MPFRRLKWLTLTDLPACAPDFTIFPHIFRKTTAFKMKAKDGTCVEDALAQLSNPKTSESVVKSLLSKLNWYVQYIFLMTIHTFSKMLKHWCVVFFIFQFQPH